MAIHRLSLLFFRLLDAASSDFFGSTHPLTMLLLVLAAHVFDFLLQVFVGFLSFVFLG